MTKIRRENADAPKLQFVNPLPSPAEPILSHYSPSIGSTSYEPFTKILQSRTTAHQPSSKRQNKRVTAQLPGVQSLALAEEPPEKILEATARHMLRDVCNATTARTLDSESPYVKLSTT